MGSWRPCEQPTAIQPATVATPRYTACEDRRRGDHGGSRGRRHRARLRARGRKSTTSAESVAATLRVPGNPGWVTAGEDAMWLSMNCDVGGACETRGLTRIDLATGTVEMTVALEGEPSFTAHVGDSLIAGHFPDGFDSPGEVLRLDWNTGEILARAPVPYGPGQLVHGGRRPVAGHLPAGRRRVDPADRSGHAPTDRRAVPGLQPAVGGSRLRRRDALGDRVRRRRAREDRRRDRRDDSQHRRPVPGRRRPRGRQRLGRESRERDGQPCRPEDDAGDRRADRHRRSLDLDRGGGRAPSGWRVRRTAR